MTTSSTSAAPRGDEGDLYRRHHRNLQRAVAQKAVSRRINLAG